MFAILQLQDNAHFEKNAQTTVMRFLHSDYDDLYIKTDVQYGTEGVECCRVVMGLIVKH